MDTLCVVVVAVGMTGLYGIRTCLKYRQRRNHMAGAIPPGNGEEIQVGAFKKSKNFSVKYSGRYWIIF
jgi:hypothetical protein